MKYILDCHCKGVHSFVLNENNGYLTRAYYADSNHELWQENKIAIHGHKFDLKMTVIFGELINISYEKSPSGEEFGEYIYQSKILCFDGWFQKIGIQNLMQINGQVLAKMQSLELKNNDLHTVYIPKNQKCLWVIQESEPSFGVENKHYSKLNLDLWEPKGLYNEGTKSDMVKYLGLHLKEIQKVTTIEN